MSKLSKVLPFLALAACPVDTDGVRYAKDCDPRDATVYPGATEICDGKDNDCDGEVDNMGLLTQKAVDDLLNKIDLEQVFEAVYEDKDGDGQISALPVGFVCESDRKFKWRPKRKGEDCDDNDPKVFTPY